MAGSGTGVMCEPIDMLLIALMGACIGVGSAAIVQMLTKPQFPATVKAVISMVFLILTLFCYVMVKTISLNAL